MYTPTTLCVFVSWIGFWIKVEQAPARVTLGVTNFLAISVQWYTRGGRFFIFLTPSCSTTPCGRMRSQVGFDLEVSVSKKVKKLKILSYFFPTGHFLTLKGSHLFFDQACSWELRKLVKAAHILPTTIRSRNDEKFTRLRAEFVFGRRIKYFLMNIYIVGFLYLLGY